MSEIEVLRQIELGPAHQPTGFTSHYAGALLPPPKALRIIRIVDDPGFLLLYLDSSGDVQTDTWHASLDDAVEQARLEFGVSAREWSPPSA